MRLALRVGVADVSARVLRSLLLARAPTGLGQAAIAAMDDGAVMTAARHFFGHHVWLAVRDSVTSWHGEEPLLTGDDGGPETPEDAADRRLGERMVALLRDDAADDIASDIAF